MELAKLIFNRRKNTAARGFTLIELVTAILVLGILAVFALPRFVNLGSDARIAALETLKGAVQSAAASANLLAITQGKTDCSTDPTVEMGGETITLRCGYPCPHPNGIGKAVDTSSNYSFVGGNCSGQGGAIDVRISDAPVSGDCKLRYSSAALNRGPKIALTTSGC